MKGIEGGIGLDMLQIHWQDYQSTGYLELLRHLIDLKREGQMRIGTIGLVNFDSVRLDEICSAMGPGEIVSNQVQVCTLSLGALFRRLC